MFTKRKRKRRAIAPPLALLPLALAAAVSAGLVVRRRRAGAGTQQTFTTPGPPSEAPAATTVEHTWSCQCGQEYRVSGEGRHRVYWLADAEVSDPVMSGRCPNCERALPGEQPEEQTDEAGAAA